MMVGGFNTWFTRNYNPPGVVDTAIKTIVDRTLAYRKQYAFIKQTDFSLSKNTLKKARDWLVQEEIISWTRTNGFTKYTIEAKQITHNFKYTGGSSTKEEEPENEIKKWERS